MTTAHNGSSGLQLSAGQSGWGLAWRLARREIRGSVARFRVFLGALMLGVAAIGTVGSVAEAMRDGIVSNARLLLGGDIEMRSLYMVPPEEIATLAGSYGTLSRTQNMRAMLQHDDMRKLVALKAVDAAWPLIGAPEIEGGTALPLAQDTILIDPALTRTMGLAVGDRVRIGTHEVTVAGILAYEPDRSVSFITFGPRVLMSMDTLAATGLDQPGAMITHRLRVLLDDGADRTS